MPRLPPVRNAGHGQTVHAPPGDIVSTIVSREPGSPLVHTGVLRDFAVATVPAAAFGAWMLGGHIARAWASGDPAASDAVRAAVWEIRALESLGLAPDAAAAPAVIGLALLLTRSFVALVVSRLWAELFARVRGRALDPSWALAAWLFVLLVPLGVSPLLLAVGLSFGLLFGCHVFGGTGSYLVSPALLGAVFLAVAYPAVFDAGAWVPGTELVPLWHAFSAGGFDGGGSFAGIEATWGSAFVGAGPATFGTGSAAACLLGAAFLIARRRVSWRAVAGAGWGIVVAGSAVSTVPWHWQPVLGSFAFVTAFVLTDPTTRARSVVGEWAQGIVFGLLTVLIRMADPTHPEGSFFALLLAALCTPLVDHFARRARPAPEPEPA